MSSREVILDIHLWNVLMGLALIGFAFFVYRRTFPPLSVRRRLLLGLFRAAAFVLLVLFILDPTFVSTVGEVSRPLVLALVDVSKSMSIADCGARSRLACSLEGVGVLEKSIGKGTGADLEVVPFASSLWVAVAQRDSFPRAEGEGTDISGVLEEAWNRFRYRNLRGIVILSDGRITRGMLAPIARPAVPVFAIGVGDTLERPNVSITDLFFERVNYVGTAATVEAVLGIPGFGEQSITVRLLEGARELDHATVTPGRGAGEARVVLRYEPDREGTKRFTVEAVPLAGEESTEDNKEPFSVLVLKDRIRILAIDEFADWNTTFLRDLVRRSERMEIETVTWRPDRGFVTVPGGARFEFPSRQAGLERYDLVVVSDDRRLLSNPSRAALLAEYVERGGGLLLLADEQSPLTALDSLRDLGRILPVAATGRTGIELGEYEVNVSAVEADHPLARSFADVPDPPPLLGRLAGIEVTSAATVPLVMRDRSGVYPFLAVQRAGDGIAAVVLGLPIWRWRLAERDGGNAYVNFVGGLVQYLAEGWDAPTLTVETPRTAYRTGERIAVTAYTREDRMVEGLRGEIYRIDEGDLLAGTFLFEPDMARGGYSRAVIGPLEAGEYRVTVAEIQRAGSGPEAQAEFSVLPVSAEFLKRSRDMTFLRHLAALSGGRVMELEGIRTLPDLLDLEPVVRERRVADELRASPFLLLATLLLLTLEWVFRKLWGLI
jgi:hypothetical protein